MRTELATTPGTTVAGDEQALLGGGQVIAVENADTV
jgi:hypothetical protein